MMRDFDKIPCKGYLPIEVRNPSVDVCLDDSMPETIDSSHWSARCYLDEQDSEARGILANSFDSDSPPLNLENGGAVRKKLCSHYPCKHCNSVEHKSKDCDFLHDMVLKNGIYTLKRDKDSDKPESSYSRSSLGNCSLRFFDNQLPIGSDELFYIPRQGDSIENNLQRLKREPPDKSVKSLRAKFSR